MYKSGHERTERNLRERFMCKSKFVQVSSFSRCNMSRMEQRKENLNNDELEQLMKSNKTKLYDDVISNLVNSNVFERQICT